MSTIVVRPENGRAIAEEYQRRILATGIEKRENYTGFSVRDRYAIGHMGELALRDALIAAGRRFIHRVVVSGKSERAEFVCFKGGQQFVIEVKTRGHPKATEFQKSKKQWDRDSHVTVGARGGSTDTVEIMGWLWTSQIEDVCLTRVHREPGDEQPTGESWFCPWDKLYRMSWVIQMLDEGGEEHEPKAAAVGVPTVRAPDGDSRRVDAVRGVRAPSAAREKARPTASASAETWSDDFPE